MRSSGLLLISNNNLSKLVWARGGLNMVCKEVQIKRFILVHAERSIFYQLLDSVVVIHNIQTFYFIPMLFKH
jgi:hypothetical protein